MCWVSNFICMNESPSWTPGTWPPDKQTDRQGTQSKQLGDPLLVVTSQSRKQSIQSIWKQSKVPPCSSPVDASRDLLAGPGWRGRLEVKEGRPCRAESSASSKLADKRCS